MAWMPSRIAARSTTAGTPVKSCSTTRVGMKGEIRSGIGRTPARDLLHVILTDVSATRVAEHILEEDPDGDGKRVERGNALLLEGPQTEEGGRTL